MPFMHYILSICTFLPILLGLFLIVTRISSSQYSKFNSKKYVQIIEKTMISKDVYSLVMKVGDSACVCISSQNGFEVIKELTEQELSELESKQNPIKEFDYSKDLAPILKTIGSNTKTIFSRITKDIQVNKTKKENKIWK